MITNSEKIKYWPYLIFLAFLVFILSFLKPAADDWNQTLNFDFHMYLLLPNYAFWRPLEALFGGFVGLFPKFFPFLYQCFTALAHIISIFYLEKLCRKIGIKNKALLFSILFFAISSTIVATVYSVDGLSQAWALTFGLLAINLYLENNGIKKYFGWLSFSVLATFAKESGIVWFIAAPLISLLFENLNLNTFYKKSHIIKNVFVDILLGLVFAGLYFLIRLYLTEGGHLGTNDRYAISFSPEQIITKLFLLLGLATTSIDTIDLFIRNNNNFLLILTIILNIPFLILLLVTILTKNIKSENIFRIIILFSLAILVSVPHVLTKTWEMHAYPAVFFIALLFGLLLNQIEWKISIKIAILLFFISTLIIDIYKWNCIYHYSESGDLLSKSIVKQSKTIPENVLVIWVDHGKGYSIYVNQPVAAFQFGAGIRTYTNWGNPKKLDQFIIDPSKNPNINSIIHKVVQESFKKYDAIWIIDGSKATVVTGK